MHKNGDLRACDRETVKSDWSRKLLLHVSPPKRDGRLPERVEWVIDNRLADMRHFAVDQPLASGAIQLNLLNPSILPIAVSRMAASLDDPSGRLYSCHPVRDALLLGSLLDSRGGGATIEVRDISECFEHGRHPATTAAPVRPASP